jgi:hypothetical protein
MKRNLVVLHKSCNGILAAVILIAFKWLDWQGTSGTNRVSGCGSLRQGHEQKGLNYCKRELNTKATVA